MHICMHTHARAHTHLHIGASEHTPCTVINCMIYELCKKILIFTAASHVIQQLLNININKLTYDEEFYYNNLLLACFYLFSFQ